MSDALLHRVAAVGLADQPPWPDRPVDADAWYRLRWNARHQRVTGLLAAAVDDGLPVTDKQRSELDIDHATFKRNAVGLEQLAVEVVLTLADAGIDALVLKGTAVSHLDYPDPSWRCYGDADLLVPPDRLRAAVRALELAGCIRDLPPRRARFEQRFAKEVTLRPAGANVEIDLHRTLALGPFGTSLPAAALWDEPEAVEIAGEHVRALSRTDRFVHACYTAVLGDPQPRLSVLRDVAQMVHRLDDPAEPLERARSWRGEIVVAEALRRSATVLSGKGWPLLDWAIERAPMPRERRWLSAYRTFGGSNTRALLMGAAGLPWRSRRAYLVGLVLPSRSYRTARRDQGRSSEWRQAMWQLRTRRGRDLSTRSRCR